MRIFWTRLCCVLAVGALFACAAAPQLDNYPRREMDRPYSLPKGVAAWNIPSVFAHVRSSSGNVTVPPIPIPLVWEQSLGENWDLLWTPLPLGARYQFFKTDEHRLGATGVLGAGFGSTSGFTVFPRIGLDYRYIAGHNIAIDGELDFIYAYDFDDTDSDWTSELGLYLVWQLHPLHSLRPGVRAGVVTGYALVNIDDELSISKRSQFVVTPAFSYQYSFHRQWDFSLAYVYSSIGFVDDFQAHVVTVNFRHLW